MSRAAHLKNLMTDVHADLADYERLAQYLEQQFNATLTHDTEALTEAGEAICALSDQLSLRQQQRMQLLSALLTGQTVSMAAVFELLPDAARTACQRLWMRLVDKAEHCKLLNQRNGNFMLAQQEALEQIFYGERDIYVAG